jgi:hypothetical protein
MIVRRARGVSYIKKTMKNYFFSSGLSVGEFNAFVNARFQLRDGV